MNNRSDPIDHEVDELLKLAKSKKFKPGIYNFCDRWCEKCKDIDKCFLYARESQKKIRNIMRGKDDSDWLEEIKDSFKITKRLIERNLQERGIDPRKILEGKPKKSWDDNVDKRYDEIQCLIKVREYMKEAANFLDNFHKSRFQYYSQTGLEVSFDDIKDEIETITWYHTFLSTKIWRTLYEKECYQREKDKDLKNLIKKDLKKFNFLVMKCINKSIKAWRNLAEKRGEFSEITKRFLLLLDSLNKEFKKNKWGRSPEFSGSDPQRGQIGKPHQF